MGGHRVRRDHRLLTRRRIARSVRLAEDVHGACGWAAHPARRRFKPGRQRVGDALVDGDGSGLAAALTAASASARLSAAGAGRDALVAARACRDLHGPERCRTEHHIRTAGDLQRRLRGRSGGQPQCQEEEGNRSRAAPPCGYAPSRGRAREPAREQGDAAPKSLIAARAVARKHPGRPSSSPGLGPARSPSTGEAFRPPRAGSRRAGGERRRRIAYASQRAVGASVRPESPAARAGRVLPHASASTSPRIEAMRSNSSGPATSGGEICTTGSPRSARATPGRPSDARSPPRRGAQPRALFHWPRGERSGRAATASTRAAAPGGSRRRGRERDVLALGSAPNITGRWR
jgi:hypothetical protein